MRSLAVISLAVLLLSSCTLLPDTDDAAAEIDVEHLTRHWVHSREEEQEAGDVQIYRPDDYKEFPASWFRMQYIFHEDGDCEWYYLAPNDAHHFRPGTWQVDATERDVIHIEKGETTSSYRILELTPNLLRMIPVATGVS